MPTRGSKPNTTSAAEKLRTVIWAAQEGDLIGSEEELTKKLGVSRPTVRQAARLLESEGLLRVKRGANGGYFAARPSVEVIEASVSAYLQMVEADDEELAEIASSLWAIVIRKAAGLPTEKTAASLDSLRSKVESLQDDATFHDMLAIEDESRDRIFEMIDSPYIELIFHINRTSALRKYPQVPSARDGSAEHREFIQTWRNAKMLELEAVSCGDLELAELAARLTRRVFHKRLWGHPRG